MSEPIIMRLSDGTTLSRLRLNGTNYVSETEVTEKTFAGKLSSVTISQSGFDQLLTNVELVQITHEEDGWWFVLREVPIEEMERRAFRSDIEYLAMMMDVEL